MSEPVIPEQPLVCGDCEYFDLGTMGIDGHSDCLSRLSDRFQTYIDSPICKSGYFPATTPGEEDSE